MSDMTVVETIWGKHHKYEVVKDAAGPFSEAKYYIRKDGKPHRGAFSSLAKAVQAAEEEG